MAEWPTGAVAGLVAGLSLATPCEAATQGRMGASSAGSVTITASVPARAAMSGLSDVLGEELRSEDASAARDLCVWSNARSGSYTITANGTGADGAFVMSSGERTIAYSVRTFGSEGSSGAPLASGAPSPALPAVRTRQECKARAGLAGLVIAIEPGAPGGANASAPYAGSLTVIVSPQ